MKKLIALTLVLLMLAGCGAATTKTGLAMITTATATSATDDANGKYDSTVTVCAATFDANGKILGVSFDAVQPAASFDSDGEIVSAGEEVKSKKEKGDEYGMKAYAPSGKEMYEQIAALEDYLVGKTVSEAVGMPVISNEGTRVADVADLKSSCTIDVGPYLDCLQKAYDNAK